MSSLQPIVSSVKVQHTLTPPRYPPKSMIVVVVVRGKWSCRPQSSNLNKIRVTGRPPATLVMILYHQLPVSRPSPCQCGENQLNNGITWEHQLEIHHPCRSRSSICPVNYFRYVVPSSIPRVLPWYLPPSALLP